jgi:hypothetical protein
MYSLLGNSVQRALHYTFTFGISVSLYHVASAIPTLTKSGGGEEFSAGVVTLTQWLAKKRERESRAESNKWPWEANN